MTAPADPSVVRGRRLGAPVVLAGAVLSLSLLLHLRDPHRGGSWGYCPWLLLTGTYCPGCGGLRAVNDLTHGDLGGAASSNLLLLVSAPFVVAWWSRWTRDRWRGVRRSVDSRRQVRLAVLFVALALCFAVLRNTDAGAWLAP
ncbi:MAG TPA: DUF2752 domain-containing protein [Nocardioidaceae bacterium]|nr:DUF2752 domain-containing protein [Nocardioidaceae bacterium]